MRPDTDYTIEEYRYSGKHDGDERALFKLLKGKMRTVTGFVGRINRDKYVITTPSATIGIRGTGGVVQVDPGTGATLLVAAERILTTPADCALTSVCRVPVVNRRSV